VDAARIKQLARGHGFELAGVTAAELVPESDYFLHWVQSGMAGEMRYLADHRAQVRLDPKQLLSSARSIICVGKLYNSPRPYSTEHTDAELAWISRYAWGDDYHDVLRRGLEALAEDLPPCEWRVAVDTAPLLERSYARRAGLGWIGKNTCLIHEGKGSWFFLGELLTSLVIEPDSPPPDRCGTCARCIEACPTLAIVPSNRPAGPQWTLDARLCISYMTIEHRGAIAEDQRAGIGSHVFGCDICQDVCPWNRHAPRTEEPAFGAGEFAPPLEKLAVLTEEQFRGMFRRTPVWRARYRGFLRNVAVAMGNSRAPHLRQPLERLARHADPIVAEHARWALRQLESR